jgi:hypothetical protein
MRRLRQIARTGLAPLALTLAFGGPLRAEGGTWTAERDVAAPSYAFIEPRTSDFNIDTVVLACEQADERRVVQLQLYLSNEGPLVPANARTDRLKTNPRAEVSIDGRVFPIDILFAGDHVVLADETDRMFPRVSDRLLDSLQEGRVMKLRLDLVAEPGRDPAAFDGEAVIDLRGADSGGVIAAVRRCGGESDLQSAALGPPHR